MKKFQVQDFDTTQLDHLEIESCGTLRENSGMKIITVTRKVILKYGLYSYFYHK